MARSSSRTRDACRRLAAAWFLTHPSGRKSAALAERSFMALARLAYHDRALTKRERKVTMGGKLSIAGIIAIILFPTITATASAQENPLTLSILKTDKKFPGITVLLFSVENKSNVRFRMTEWSCVFWNGNDPVYEERSIVHNVPPQGRAIKNVGQSYGGPFTKIECRYMDADPHITE
jgi:hypothetical protein